MNYRYARKKTKVLTTSETSCIVLCSSIYIAPLNSHRQTEALLVRLAPRKERSFKKTVIRTYKDWMIGEISDVGTVCWNKWTHMHTDHKRRRLRERDKV